jgi:hypothetical protein
MRVKRVEHIYLSNEEIRVWSDFGGFLDELQNKTENIKVKALIDDIQDKIFELSDFVEEEE